MRASKTKPEPLVNYRGLKLFRPDLEMQIVEGTTLERMVVSLEMLTSGMVSLHQNEDGAVRGFLNLEAAASRKIGCE